MKISDLIKRLETELRLQGDLEVFDANYFSDMVTSVEDGKDFPKDWDMPEKFLRIGEQN